MSAQDAAASQSSFLPIVSAALHSDLSPALSAIKPLAPAPGAGERSEIPNFILPKVFPESKDEPPATPQSAGDQALQSQPGFGGPMPAPLANFDGVGNVNGVHPPDTNGDVGYDAASGRKYYVQWVNLSFQMWDVASPAAPVSVYGPANGNTLWAGFGGACETTNHGDPIVLFDEQARRWLMSQFALPNYPSGPYYQCLAVSQTANPTGAWYRYAFQASATKMNDYPHLGVWPDATYNAYFMTANQFVGGQSWGGAGVFAFERAQMLAGDPNARMIYFDLFNVNASFGGMLPADLDGPPPAPSAPGYFFEVDDDVVSPALGVDAMRVWEFRPDWTDPASSTFGLSGNPNAVLPVAGFDLLPCTLSFSRNCIPQPGTAQRLDAIGDRLMHRVALRSFGGYQAAVLNHTVKADGADRAGVRWYEVRNAGGAWSIYQQGTYAPADGEYRWMGSVALDAQGGIALGYSVSSSSIYPSIRYAGRLRGDPLNTLPQAEVTLVAGSGAQESYYARWGDYAMMGVDPLDACTFWFTTEYIQTTGFADWKTRIGAFKYPGCSVGPVGALSGAVSNASDGAPIAGAQIAASASPTQTVVTEAGAGGAYSMTVPVATYTVTASAYGYNPSVATGVAVISGTTTTRSFALTPSPGYVVSGTVKDAAAGWPLYARINIAGWPPGSLWNDPVTGFYSVTLAAGVTHTFTVSAWTAGYNAAARAVAPLTGSRTESFGLSADLTACAAPGYAYTGGFTENFDSAAPPALPSGWAAAIITGTWGAWSTNAATVHPYGQPPRSAPNLVYFNSYSAPFGDAVRLYRTGGLNMTSVPTTTLTYWVYHDTNYAGYADRVQAQVSTNGGATWQNVGAPVLRYDGSAGWKPHALSLSAYAGATSLQLGFLGLSAYGNDLHMDDVRLGSVCAPQSGGLVVGQVFDANTSAGLTGARVTNDSGRAATTAVTSDLAAADAFYALFSPAGTHVFTATVAGSNYGADVRTPTVALGSTVGQDFYLPAGRLSLSPPARAVTLTLGASTTAPLTLLNTGVAPAAFELKEIPKGFDATLIGPYEPPEFVVKPFKQGYRSSEGLGLPPPPAAPPYAAGDVIQSWPTGLTGAWSLAYDVDDESVWVGSPAANWGGSNTFYEYTRGGAPTGRAHPFSWNPAYGPGDAAFNLNTGRLWVMNISTGGDNCIFEMDPATGYTGNFLCPGGSGFSVSQRGLAYDPETDTYFAGSWNDYMIHRFDASGALLADVNVGLPVAGLAYNPDTQHLFVMINWAPSLVYVLDAAPGANYAVVGQFGIAGFSDYGGAGLEMDCDGKLWAVDQAAKKVYQIESGETTSMCQSDVPWLTETPVSGAVTSAANQPLTLGFDASVVDQPGEYRAQLKVRHNTPYPLANIPITMTVTAPANWGQAHGRVYGLGYCDRNPSLLTGATVLVTTTTGLTQTFTLGASDPWSWWAPAGVMTVTASAPNHAPQTIPTNVVAGQGINQDVDLRWQHNCGSVSPSPLELTLPPDIFQNVEIALANAGTLPWSWSLAETSGWLTISGPLTGTTGADSSLSTQLTISTAGMLPGGTYEAIVAVTHDDDGAPNPLPLLVRVTIASVPVTGSYPLYLPLVVK